VSDNERVAFSARMLTTYAEEFGLHRDVGAAMEKGVVSAEALAAEARGPRPGNAFPPSIQGPFQRLCSG